MTWAVVGGLTFTGPREHVGHGHADHPQADEGDERGDERGARAVDDAVAHEREAEEDVAGAHDAQVRRPQLQHARIRVEHPQERLREASRRFIRRVSMSRLFEQWNGERVEGCNLE